jgi:hypothetical protein
VPNLEFETHVIDRKKSGGIGERQSQSEREAARPQLQAHSSQFPPAKKPLSQSVTSRTLSAANQGSGAIPRALGEECVVRNCRPDVENGEHEAGSRQEQMQVTQRNASGENTRICVGPFCWTAPVQAPFLLLYRLLVFRHVLLIFDGQRGAVIRRNHDEVVGRRPSREHISLTRGGCTVLLLDCCDDGCAS